jgi:hypothetical protein
MTRKPYKTQMCVSILKKDHKKTNRWVEGELISLITFKEHNVDIVLISQVLLDKIKPNFYYC